MYSDYVKKSRFFRLAEKVETSMDGVGLENAAYVAIRKSVKSSDWYRNITDSYRESVDFLLSTDHNIRLANVRARPLGGAATANGQEVPSDDKWATVYDEVAMGMRGITVTLPARYVTPIDPGSNVIPKVPDSWKYKFEQKIEPVEVKLEDKYSNPKFNTRIPGTEIKSARIQRPRKAN